MPEHVTRYLLVGLGGGLGSMLRYMVGGYASSRMNARFPYGTFLVNCTGCFLIGLVVAVLAERTDLSPNWKYLIPIGFIGGYTTFSSFELETFRSVENGEMLIAGLNVSLSVVIGFIGVWLGMIAGKHVAS
jgi:fluoride exporter